MASQKRFEKIFLHIGLGKTGSTYVQHDLFAKAELLETKFDLHYPHRFSHYPEFNGNHSLLLRAMFSKNPNVQKRLQLLNLHSSEDIQMYNQTTLEQLHRGFSESNASRMLLSAEVVAHFQQPRLRELAEWLKNYTDDIQVIGCVRSPLKSLSSVIQQRLTTGKTLEEMYQDPPYHNFEELFSRVERAFGEERVKVYSFDEAANSDLGLTGSFMYMLGLDAGDDFPRRPAVNSSMSHEAAYLLSAFNKLCPVYIDDKVNPERMAVPISFFTNIPGRRFSAPQAVHEMVKERTREGLEWLRARYGIEFGEAEDAAGGETAEGVFSEVAVDHLARMISRYAISQVSDATRRN